MSPVSQKVVRAGLLGIVGVTAVLAATMVVDRHHARMALSTPPDESGAALQSGFGNLHLAPAVSYANLKVYPVYVDGPAPGKPAASEFVTLAEGMDRGTVTARESDCQCAPGSSLPPALPAGVTVPDSDATNAEQGEEYRDANLLMVTNVSPQPTYVPDGQVVPGGGQDRGAAADTIIPARSAQVGVAAFCVEQNRSEGPSPAFRKTVAIAIPSVRYAMQVSGEQQPVWKAVAVATDHFGATTSTGTYAALIQNRAAQAATLPYSEALTVPIQAANQGRVVGVVAAINGRIVCADLYRSPGLFNQLWPSLLQSYALQAAMSAPKVGKTPLTNSVGAARWLASLDSAPGQPSRQATFTEVARISNRNGAGIRTAAIAPAGTTHRLSLLHEAFWTPAAVLTN